MLLMKMPVHKPSVHKESCYKENTSLRKVKLLDRLQLTATSSEL